MAMVMSNYPDATSVNTIPAAYVWISQTSFNWKDSTGSITILVHRDSASASAGKVPIATITYALTPDGANGTLNFSQMLADSQAAYGALRTALYQAIGALPEWAGATPA